MWDAEIQLLNYKLKVKGAWATGIQRINDHAYLMRNKSARDGAQAWWTVYQDEEKPEKGAGRRDYFPVWTKIKRRWKLLPCLIMKQDFQGGLVEAADCKMYITIRFSTTRQSSEEKKNQARGTDA